MPVALPIDAHLDAIRTALNAHRIVLLSAPPGSGKTTRVPPALLDAGWLAGQGMIMLEPRRLATRAAARRMAEERGEPVGETIGYRVRFDHAVSANTRIEVVTEAILTRRLQSDPELAGIGLVIFDEFHERNLHSDLGLALCRDVQTALREDLRLLIMSATLDVDALRRGLDVGVGPDRDNASAGEPLSGDVALIEAPGRAYPVDLHYLPRDPDARIEEIALAGVRRALRETRGDVLTFLPGGGEIRRVSEALAGERDVAVLPLYGDLSPAAQDQALAPDPQGRRKVVLATPIAETSLTIPGVRVVVDTGLARVPGFDAASGLDRLRLMRISRASAEQRAGRAGRQGPGVCYRLWSETTQQGLLAHLPPEIVVSDLAPMVLELALWGIDSPNALTWIDPPPDGHYRQARQLLRELGALDADDRITAFGRRLSEPGAHPRVAAMLLRADQLGDGARALASDLAALLGERDLFRVGPGSSGGSDPRRGVDVERRLAALAAFRRGGRDEVRALGADPGACGQVARVARQYGGGKFNAGRFDARGTSARATDIAPPADSGLAGQLLMRAFPDRIAQRRAAPDDGGPARYRLANGRGAWLPAGDELGRAEWLVAARLDAGQGEARILAAARVTRDDIEAAFAERIESVAVATWDERAGRVVARRERRLGALVLAAQAWPDPPPEVFQRGLLDAIRRKGLAVLPWSAAQRDLLARVRFLAAHDAACDTGNSWPDWSESALLADLEIWLLPWMDDVRALDHLKGVDLGAALNAVLGWERQQRLDSLAPTHWTVPSGSRVRIDYQGGDIPVLAVRLQEMFGATETPRIVAGSVPLLLHLLSPARRPIQVTQDLAGFWERTYAEVKKELKGRYPKHHWPDDPLRAQPTARAKPRR